MNKILGLLMLFFLGSKELFSQSHPLKFTLNKSKGTELVIKLAAREDGAEIEVDWGDGSIKKYTVSNKATIATATVLNGNVGKKGEVKLYSSARLFWLNASGQELTGVDFTANNDLEQVDISDNQIKKVDLSKNSNLKALYAKMNQIGDIDLSYNSKLTLLNLSNNQLLGSIDLSMNNNLQNVTISNTKIAMIKFDNPLKMHSLNLSNNQLNDIESATLSALKVMDISKNKINTCSLNKIYSLLPILNERVEKINLKVIGNEGLTASDTKIAEDKFWTIDKRGDGAMKCK